MTLSEIPSTLFTLEKCQKEEEDALNETSPPGHYPYPCMCRERVMEGQGNQGSAASLTLKSWPSSALHQVVFRPQPLLPISFSESIIILCLLLLREMLFMENFMGEMEGRIYSTQHTQHIRSLLQMLIADFSILSEILSHGPITCDPPPLFPCT